MKLSVFSGTAEEIGVNYGRKFAEQIAVNVDILVKRTGYEPLPHGDPDFEKWVDDQETLISDNWPWLREEMTGVAIGAEQDFRDIFLLNLRVWQYGLYSGKGADNCSSMVITLSDGSVANCGALDDPDTYYCGLVKWVPDSGCSFFTFPIAGTSWGNRGINNAGLSMGISSQVLPGLNVRPGTICQDLAMRVILQQCENCRDVRRLCREFPFTVNLVCSDSTGEVFCAHQTAAGLFEMADLAPYVITNHIVDDTIKEKLTSLGVTSYPESTTTRLRWERLVEFYTREDGRCSAEEVRACTAGRLDGDPASVCPKGNYVLTYSNSQDKIGELWVAEPQKQGHEEWTAFNL